MLINQTLAGFTLCAIHNMLFQCLQEAAIESKFTEVNAVNSQRLQNLEFADSLLKQVKHFLMIILTTITATSEAIINENNNINNCPSIAT